MFGRENLIWEYAEDLESTEMVYRTEDVNEVMDKMESRIKELESDLSMMETDYEFRIKNTVKVLKNTELILQNRIKELEYENAQLDDDWQKTYAEECITRHENHRLVERIEELEKENNQLKQELEGTYNLLAHNLGIGNYGN